VIPVNIGRSSSCEFSEMLGVTASLVCLWLGLALSLLTRRPCSQRLDPRLMVGHVPRAGGGRSADLIAALLSVDSVVFDIERAARVELSGAELEARLRDWKGPPAPLHRRRLRQVRRARLFGRRKSLSPRFPQSSVPPSKEGSNAMAII